MEFKRDIKDQLLMVALVLLAAVQILIVTVHVYGFVPIHWNVVTPKGLELERESFIYLIFLGVAMVMMAAVFTLVRPRLASSEGRVFWLRLCCMEAFWTFLQLFAFFKWITYRYPFYNILPYENGGWVIPFFYGVLFCSLLSKIFWPEVNKFIDLYYPRWSAFNLSRTKYWLVYLCVAAGIYILLVPDSQAIVALGYVWDQFNHWDEFPLTAYLLRHGLSYSSVVVVLFSMLVIFWSLVFIAVNRWLGSFWLAAFAVVMGIKINLFHYGVTPAALIVPQVTVLSPGVDLMSILGLGNVPIYDALRVRQFFSFFMGFFLPVFYVFSVALILGGAELKRLGLKEKIAVALACYGLLTYSTYVSRPTLFSYGTVALPAVLLFSFWIAYCVRRVLGKHSKVIFALCACLALSALLTNRMFVTYPHALNVYGQNFSKEKNFFLQTFQLSKEAMLISGLVPATEKVAILSSFETAILAKAKREPMIRPFPLMGSTSLMDRNVGLLRVKRKDDLLKVVKILERERPVYIFIEQKIWALPPEARNAYPGLFVLIDWIKSRYDVGEQGGRILSLKRR